MITNPDEATHTFLDEERTGMNDILGPLSGVKVVEFSGIGPGPQAVWQLGALGASVTTIDKPGAAVGLDRHAANTRLRIELDLRSAEGRERALGIVASADVLIEGFRAGVMERLGLGPLECHAVNPRLVYGRMTGWGQHGPLAGRAGHDINYIGLTGVLHAIAGHDQHPVPPLNLVGDFGGGTMFLVVGVLSALLARQQTDRGCVVDAAIVDGTLQLSNMIWQLRGRGAWRDGQRSNQLDGGAPYYDVYSCKGGGYMAVGALEPQFYAELLDVLDLHPGAVPDRRDRENWPALRNILATTIRTRTRDEWTALSENRDACFTPVLDFGEVGSHPHIVARQALLDHGSSTRSLPLHRDSRPHRRCHQEPEAAVNEQQHCRAARSESIRLKFQSAVGGSQSQRPA